MQFVFLIYWIYYFDNNILLLKVTNYIHKIKTWSKIICASIHTTIMKRYFHDIYICSGNFQSGGSKSASNLIFYLSTLLVFQCHKIKEKLNSYILEIFVHVSTKKVRNHKNVLYIWKNMLPFYISQFLLPKLLIFIFLLKAKL